MTHLRAANMPAENSLGYLANGSGLQRKSERAVPALRDGQVRCPVCRNGVTPTPRGFLRQHRDVYGQRCYNKAVA